MSAHGQVRMRNARAQAQVWPVSKCMACGFIHAKAKAWTLADSPFAKARISRAGGWTALATAVGDGHPMRQVLLDRARGGGA